LEGQLKDKDCELLKRDRVITDLRVRLPASSDRDAIFDKVASQSAKSPRDEDYESSQAVRVATCTVSSLQVATVVYTLSSGYNIVSLLLIDRAIRRNWVMLYWLVDKYRMTQ